MVKKVFFLVLFPSMILFSINKVFACESCMISRIGKDSGMRRESADKRWSFEYLFEQKNYDRMDASDAHTLHHQGHEVHDKTTEDFHHLIFGANLNDQLSLSLEVPYVIRRSLEVDNHDTLGDKRRCEGLGDTTLLSEYSFWKSNQQSVGVVGGVKFPTGYTGEKNTVGDKFEPELQPGSGSFDYIFGGVYKRQGERMNIAGNVSCVFNTEGVYDFEFGDMFTVSTSIDYLLNPQVSKFQARIGMDVIYDNEWKEKQNGLKNPDSAATKILTGPVFNVTTFSQNSILGSVLFPAYQDVGGVHQELDYVWTLGTKIRW